MQRLKTPREKSGYYGRDFSAGEMALLRALIVAEPPPTRHVLSREIAACHTEPIPVIA